MLADSEGSGEHPFKVTVVGSTPIASANMLV